MGICSSPAPPPAPDYVGAAKQQGASNLEAAVAEGKINNPNVSNPYGTQTVTWGQPDRASYDQAMVEYQRSVHDSQGANTWLQQARAGLIPNVTQAQIDEHATLANQGTSVKPPSLSDFSNPNQPTITQTLSPEQQALYQQETGNQQKLGNLAAQGIQAAQGIIGTPVDYAGAPPMPGGSEAIRNQVYEAMMSRPREDLGIKRDNLNSNLVAAGVRPGSQAYDAQANLLNRQETDAQMQALLAGGVEAQRNYGMDLQSRQQGLSEQAAMRQMPLNEITALMSGSQVTNPFQMPNYAQNANVAPAPMYQATNDAGQYSTDVYNAKMANQGQMASGLFGLGGAGLMAGATAFASDRRTKRNVTRIGTHPLGIGLYRFRYKSRYQRQWGHGWKVGVMADEALTVRPEAVVRHADGYWLVDYGRL